MAGEVEGDGENKLTANMNRLRSLVRDYIDRVSLYYKVYLLPKIQIIYFNGFHVAARNVFTLWPQNVHLSPTLKLSIKSYQIDLII